MNPPPPSALHSAMSRERKPFTYTPGGLNLSEIKSERMAQRLMRNAMNQGVPEKPIEAIKSPPVLTSNVIPNFNCLPVQVFPTFSLPANPKSLLRTRSNPDTPKAPPTIALPKSCADNTSNVYSYKDVNKPSISTLNNNSDNNKQSTFNDCNITPNNYSFWQPKSYESDTSKCLLQQCEINSNLLLSKPSEIKANTRKSDINEENNTASNEESSKISDDLLENSESNKINFIVSNFPYLQEKKDDDYEKKEVKIAKKDSKSNNEIDQNGDTEAEIVVKLPSKKSAAKTETTVDVLKKILPDGTVEEVKTTTTKTTVDGKTEITTKTETRTFPKEVNESEEIEEQEDEFDEIIEENGHEEDYNESNEVEISKSINKKDDRQEEDNDQITVEVLKQTNVQNGHIIIEEEKTEKNTTKKVVISQSADEESEEEIEEVDEEEDGQTEDISTEQVIVLKKSSNTQSDSQVDSIKESSSQEGDNIKETEEEKLEDDEEIIEDEEVIEEEEYENEEEKDNDIEKIETVVEGLIENKDKQIELEVGSQGIKANELSPNSKEEVDVNEDKDEGEGEDEGEDECEDKDEDENERQSKEKDKGEREDKDENEDEGDEKYVEAKDIQEEIYSTQTKNENEQEDSNDTKKVIIPESVASPQSQTNEEKLSAHDFQSEPIKENKKHERKEETIIKTTLQYEPSIPLEKVEDVEIKPIGPAQEIFKKSHTEIITTTTDKPIGALSTQTEFNRVENIVTVNRTSKILDHAYEQISQSAAPASNLNTYFSQNINRIPSSPQPLLRPHQPIYTPEPQTERRHSLLLDRLSVERQIPTSDIYQNTYQPAQNQELPQWLQEPQSEVLTVSNVKPSEITKNQQWYQQPRKEESIYNTTTPLPNTPTPQWNKPQVQQHYISPPQVQAQPTLQSQYQTFPPQYSPKPEYTQSFTENICHSKSNNVQQNTYPSYVPKPTWVSSTFDPKPSLPSSKQFSTIKKESSESYQTSTQQLSSSYVPPPWEQDSSYVSNTSNYYQPPPPTTTLTSSINPAWTPQPTSKFSKPAPMSYVPPAPNQSFVKPVTTDNPPRLPGRKTYYSEYERRYISVPEATYIPSESKRSDVQPDPSPQYYYDNNEPTEPVEPQWRRELREFTEKTQTTQNETTTVRPPWEEDSKYTAPLDYTPVPPTNWTQTVRPRSWRERSFEAENISSNEWPRTNTLGRGRPQSSYIKSNVDTLPQRPRGVSVDRYNPNSYLSPTSEHPPVQSQTMNPNIHPKTYHNPSIPSYHARVPAELREQPAYVQPRSYVDSRAPPVQSRSFKYLQWITGTED